MQKRTIIKRIKTIIENYGSFSIGEVDNADGVLINEMGHLIGIAEYSLTEFNDQYEGEAMLIISSNQDDANLVVMRPHVTKLFNLLKTGMEIPIIRSVDGYMLGNLKLKAGSSVMPVARTQSRPLQAISFSFGLALISQP